MSEDVRHVEERTPIGRGHYMTVADVRRAIASLPDDAPVLYQRIEDVYFDRHGWQRRVVYKHCAESPVDPDEYIPAFGAVKYHGDSALYITAHY